MNENSNPLQFTVESAGERLDKLVASHFPDHSRVQVQAWIREGFVTINGAAAKPGEKLRVGAVITVTPPEPATPAALPEPEAIELHVAYEDNDLAVIHKPVKLIVHPGAGNPRGTLVNAILARWPEIGQITDHHNRQGIVHRLDKDTSGLMVIAKNRLALRRLMQQFQARTVKKRYSALLERMPKTRSGRINAPIGRDPHQRQRMAVQRDGREAVTEFIVVDDHFPSGQALVEFDLLTGRTHQIRVHAAFINAPVLGDRIYGTRRGRADQTIERLCLHAAQLEFDQPTSGQRLQFEAALPPDFQAIVERLKSGHPL